MCFMFSFLWTLFRNVIRSHVLSQLMGSHLLLFLGIKVNSICNLFCQPSNLSVHILWSNLMLRGKVTSLIEVNLLKIHFKMSLNFIPIKSNFFLDFLFCYNQKIKWVKQGYFQCIHNYICVLLGFLFIHGQYLSVRESYKYIL